MEIVTLQDARERRLVRYFTGHPCKRGHICERSTARRGCVQCGLDWEKDWRKSDPDAARGKDKKRHANRADQEREYRKNYRLENGGNLREKYRCEYAANPEKFREKSRSYTKKNRETVIARSRERYAANREAAIEYVRQWQKAHPETMRAIWRNKYARKLAATGTHSKEDVADILKMQRGRCAYCKHKVGDDYHVDHITALINGGSNDRKNLQVLCPTCNMSKHRKDPIAYSQSIGLLL